MTKKTKAPQEFKIGKDLVVKLSQDEPTAKQEEWKSRLVLVSALPERMVGIVENLDAIDNRQPFKLHATLIYVAELEFAPVIEMQETPKGMVPVMGPNGQPKVRGMQAGTRIHALVPYDLIGVPTIDINTYQYAIRVADQEELFKEWMYREYLSFFDPPRVQLAR